MKRFILQIAALFIYLPLWAQENQYDLYKDSDFVPGEKIVFFDDFSTNLPGTTPKGWEAVCEYEVIEYGSPGEKWLSIIHGGGFYPVDLTSLPENFTLEFQAAAVPGTANGTLDLRFIPASEQNPADPWFNNSTIISLSPTTQIPKRGGLSISRKDTESNELEINPREFYFAEWFTDIYPLATIELSKTGSRASVYVNQKKIVDNQEIFSPGQKYRLGFHFGDYFIEDIKFYMKDIRIATEAAKPKKDFEKGSFVTSNILFDVNSDHIKPQSYTVLKGIADAIGANPGIKLKIIGHTDSDGSDNANLLLSKKRAEAVRNTLSKDFGIDTSGFLTDGKGEEEPIDSNDTSSGKARNRRVEFVKY